MIAGGTERKELIKRILRTVETKQKLKEPPGPLEGLSRDTEEMIIPKSNDDNSGHNVLLDERLLETETKQNQQDTIEKSKEQKILAGNTGSSVVLII